MRFIKYLILGTIAIISCSCSKAVLVGEKKSTKAKQEQQEQVKNQVMELLEEEYKQPFKLESFDYKYEAHWSDPSCQLAICPKKIYGTYYLKAKAVDNPIIVVSIKLNDGLATKESIKPLIDSFKKNQLKDVYCSALGDHYIDNKISVNSKLSKEEIRNNKYCDARGQTEMYNNIYTQNQ